MRLCIVIALYIVVNNIFNSFEFNAAVSAGNKFINSYFGLLLSLGGSICTAVFISAVLNLFDSLDCSVCYIINLRAACKSKNEGSNENNAKNLFNCFLHYFWYPFQYELSITKLLLFKFIINSSKSQYQKWKLVKLLLFL